MNVMRKKASWMDRRKAAGKKPLFVRDYSPDEPRDDHGRWSANFNAWFGDSKVVDANGKPLVMYHGTRSDFEAFAKIDGGNAYGDGFYFTSDPSKASDYATGENVNRMTLPGNAGPNVMPVYLSAQKPFTPRGLLSKEDVDAIEKASGDYFKKGELWKTFDKAYPPNGDNVLYQLPDNKIEILKAAGFDSMNTEYGWVVFNPNQIKSAIGSKFNPKSNKITDAAPDYISPLQSDFRDDFSHRWDGVCAAVTEGLKTYDFTGVGDRVRPFQNWIDQLMSSRLMGTWMDAYLSKAAALANAHVLTLDYDPNEPRDKQGQWTASGDPLDYSDFKPPTKTLHAYKLFRTLKSRPGEIFPTQVGIGQSIPMHKWVPAEYKATKGFAVRPGWHGGTVPLAPQMRSRAGVKQDHLVWGEVEFEADQHDAIQAAADAQPNKMLTAMIPKGGYYKFHPGHKNYRDSWVISGAMKVNRLLSDDEVHDILIKAGYPEDAKKEAPHRTIQDAYNPDQPRGDDGKWIQRPYATTSAIRFKGKIYTHHMYNRTPEEDDAEENYSLDLDNHGGAMAALLQEHTEAEIEEAFGKEGDMEFGYSTPSGKFFGLKGQWKVRDADIDWMRTLQDHTDAELQGIIDATSQQAARVMANNIIARKNPTQDVLTILTKVGEARSLMLADYMVMKVFTVATLEAFRAAGHTHVGIIPETLPHVHVGDAARKSVQKRHPKTGKFVSYTKPLSRANRRKAEKQHVLMRELAEVNVLTAEDDRVCQICEDIADAGPYSIDHALSLIPAHINCRCIFIPTGQLEMTDFDPGEARDEHGRWTRTGEKSLGHAVKSLREYADYTAKTRGYDPDKIYFSNQHFSFEVNGMKMFAQAGAVTETEKVGDETYHEGDIVIFKNEYSGLDQEFPVQSTIAHEIEHQKFHTVMKMAEKESLAARKAGHVLGSGKLMSKYAKKYPTMAALQDTALKYDMAPVGNDVLAKTDGITDYSKQYWIALNKGDETVPHRLAVDETLAAIAQLEEGGELHTLAFGPDGKPKGFRKKASPEWMHLYNTVNDLYAKTKLVKDFNPLHDPKNGEFTGKLGESEPAFKAPKAKKEPLQFLALSRMDAMQGKSLRDFVEKQAKYAGDLPSVDKLLLEHGKAYMPDANTFAGPRGAPQMCYMNAAQAVMADPTLTYCEGYADVEGMAVGHGWYLDKDGHVIDPTLRSLHKVRGYFGIPFNSNYMMISIMKNKVWGLLGSKSKKTLPALLTGKEKGFLKDA